MPWKGLSIMDTKERFARDAMQDGANIRALCRSYGICPETGYRILRRYQAKGRDGLMPQSRAPHTSPQAWNKFWRKRALDLRQEYKWGGRKINTLLCERFPAEEVPTPSTIDRWIKGAGLCRPRRIRRRHPPREAPLADVTAPGQTYCADFKGEFKLANGLYCYPLTVTDAYSRFILGCFALRGPELAPTWRCFEQIFAEYGLPERIRTDNGTPFASTGLCRFSQLSVWWYQLGITVERIDPGRPDQNGRHERMHRTLKEDATEPPGGSFRQQQDMFDHFRGRFNTIRPHEALGMDTPSKHYTKSPRKLPKRLKPFIYPAWYETRTVGANSCIKFRNRDVVIGRAFAGQRIGLRAIDEILWQIFLGDLMLGILDTDKAAVIAHSNNMPISNRRRFQA